MSVENLNGQYSTTNNGRPFLQYDNMSHTNRILVFFSHAAFKTLAKCNTWYSDGTFKVAPVDFYQLYTLHGIEQHGQSFPAVFVLTQHKNESTYKEIFGAIKDISMQLNVELNPKVVISDFEKAASNAIRYHFPSIQITGCWFHFCQAILRKSVNTLGKNTTQIQSYRDWLAKFYTLALIPIEKINDALEKIENSIPHQDCEIIIKYFKSQWIDKIKPEVWNHYERSEHRTNNQAEGFHSNLNRLLTSSHPNLYALINLLKQLETSSVIQLERVNIHKSAVSVIRRKKDIEKDTIIELIKQEYKCHSISFDEFFEKMCNQVLDPFIFNTKFLSNKLLKNYKNICFI